MKFILWRWKSFLYLLLLFGLFSIAFTEHPAERTKTELFSHSPSQKLKYGTALYQTHEMRREFLEKGKEKKKEGEEENLKLLTDITFIHIPKTGGTTIRNQFYGPNWRQIGEKVELNHRCSGSNNSCGWWEISPSHLTRLTVDFHNPVRFCVIRNPFTRALDDFFGDQSHLVRILETEARESRKAQTCFSDIVISTIEAFVARLSKEYFQKKKLDCHKCSFVPMIDYVEDYVDSEYIQKLRKLLITDPEMTCSEAIIKLRSKRETGRLCNFPLYFEHFSEELDFFLDRCARKGREKKKEGDSQLGGEYWRMKSARREEEKKFVLAKLMLIPQARLLIEKLFKYDLARFNYSSPFWSGVCAEEIEDREEFKIELEEWKKRGEEVPESWEKDPLEGRRLLRERMEEEQEKKQEKRPDRLRQPRLVLRKKIII